MPITSGGSLFQPNPIATSPAATGGGTPYLNSLVPGNQNLLNSAATNTQNLLNGLPTTSVARKANAVFGAGNGMAPGSDFLKTRLYDTYGGEVDARNQQGLQNYMSLIGAVSSPELASSGQNNQVNQFNQSLANQKQQFADNLKQRQEEFNRSNDLALQEFGFNRSRYYNSIAPSNHGVINEIPSAVPGSAEANFNITQRHNANPSTFWN